MTNNSSNNNGDNNDDNNNINNDNDNNDSNDKLNDINKKNIDLSSESESNSESNSDNELENKQNDSEPKINDSEPKINDDFMDINVMLGKLIKDAFKLDDPKNGFVPVGIDFKIENYDEGKLKSEKSFEIKKDDKSWSNFSPIFYYDIKKPSDKPNDKPDVKPNDKPNDKQDIKPDVKPDVKPNVKSNVKSNVKTNWQHDPNKILIIKQINNSQQITKVDYASSIGDEKYLNEWIKSNIDSKNKFNGNSNDYTSESIDNASSNGKINILNWWSNAKKQYKIELKYTEKAMNFASKFDHIEILDWWINSGLDLKYNSNAIDFASAGCKINSLDWWINAKKNNGLRFEHTSNSIDNAKLSEEKLLKLINWWKSTITTFPSIKFKYTREFIDYLESWAFEDIYKYLQENKMISQEEKFNPNNKNNSNNSNKSNSTSNIFDFLGMIGMPINIGAQSKSKESVSSKYDLSLFPEDIQKHIREKEEELSNNMLINGKAKEYIDNLIKIPFGKYKIEKIFSFIEDLIQKLNSINSKSSNDNIKSYKITNESDIVVFFEKTKYFSDNTYNKYSKLFDNFVELRQEYMRYVNRILNEIVYGHDATKKHIKCIISQWLSGGFKSGVVIGIQGPPGVGKTTMIKGALSKCLIDFIDYNLDLDEPYINKIDYSDSDSDSDSNSIGRPFCFMSLGGTTNGSTLSGHNITYHGATSGDIVKNLKEAKIMNPILYFDELDKISNTEHGHEISSVLTHITDPVQNAHFTDRYFSEVKIDLSKCIIVFSYNDSKKIDRILLDRIQEIRLNPIKHKEKIIICKKFIIPEICKQLGYNLSQIDISDDKLDLIISDYTLEAGIRKLKEKLYEIFRMNHLDLIENHSSKLKSTDMKIISYKFINDTFSDHPKIIYKKIKSSNMIGCINGLYASSTGIGGITPIQVKQIFSKEILSIGITGSVEKVMEESVKVAKTVGWNLLTRDEQDNVIKQWDQRGLHVHFPDGSTSKDGPSGGTAITCAIYSLLINKPIKNNIAITGEIDLDGNVTEIGGLDAKLNGAKKAGVNLVLIPSENHRELEIVKKNNPELIDKTFKVIKISHVKDALKNIF